MKKAKEYAVDYMAAQDKADALAKVLSEMHQETVILMKHRGVKSDSGMLAILNETDDKFRSFARQVGDGINPRSFAFIIDRFHSQVYMVWVRFFPGRAHGVREAAPAPEIAGRANCGCVYHAEQGIPCKHDLELAGLPPE